MTVDRADAASPWLGRRDRLIIAALRRWSRARAVRRSPMPQLFRLLAPVGAGMLVVALDGFFTLAEAHQGRPMQVGHSNELRLTADEAAVLNLIRWPDDRLMPTGEQRLEDVHGKPLLRAAAQIARQQVIDELAPVGGDARSRQGERGDGRGA